MTTPDPTRARLRRQIAYIIENEGCERFSFYGMRNILTQVLVSSALPVTSHTSNTSKYRSEANRKASKTVFGEGGTSTGNGNSSATFRLLAEFAVINFKFP